MGLGSMKIEEFIFYSEAKYVKITSLKSLCLLILFSTFLISCSGQNGSMAYNKLGALDKECEYRLNAGEDITDFTFSEEAVEVDHFGKLYNVDFLEKILKSSGQATLKFAHSLGIKTLRVEQSQSNCQMFSFLEEARGEPLKAWMDLVEQNEGRTPGGLYTFFSHSDSPLLPIDPTILLRIDANRWTLVHELMHYNFSKTSLQTYGFWEKMELENDYSSKKEALDINLQGYLKHKNLESFKSLIESVASVVKILDDYILEGQRTPIQEISIEYILIKSYLEGKFTYVPNNQLWSAYSYMSGNTRLLLETFVYPVKNIVDKHLIGTSEVYWEYKEQVQDLSEEINRYPTTFENALKQVEKSIKSGEWVEE